MCKALVAGALLALAVSCSAAAEEADNLYQNVMVTSGTGEDRRPAAFAQLFTRILVKVSGDRRLASDARVAGLAADAASYISDFTYRDRMGGIPLHDEQGSHDRPHDLTATFIPDKIDAALHDLGSAPWPLPRPRLVLFVAARNGDLIYTATADGPREPGMRDALAVAGDRAGMHAAFATEADAASAGLNFETLPNADLDALDAVAKLEGGDVAIEGTLDFSDAEFGWIVDWRMQWQGTAHAWQIRGVNYDTALANAVAGAAQILSGNGAPD
jgi:hypothetical protein